MGVAGHGTPVILAAAPAWWYCSAAAADGGRAAAAAALLIIDGGLGLLSVEGLAVLLTGSSAARLDPAEPRCRMNGVDTIAARIINPLPTTTTNQA